MRTAPGSSDMFCQSPKRCYSRLVILAQTRLRNFPLCLLKAGITTGENLAPPAPMNSGSRRGFV